RHRHDKAVFTYFLEGEKLVVGYRWMEESRVDLSTRQSLGLLRSRHLKTRYVCSRIPGNELFHHLGKIMIRSATLKADRKRFTSTRCHVPGGFQRLRMVLQRDPRTLGKGGASHCERDGALSALDQWSADNFFQALDLAGERWLRNTEPRGGPTETQFFRQGREVTKLAGTGVSSRGPYVRGLRPA